MSSSNNPAPNLVLGFSYLAVVGMAVYFSKAMTTIHPAYWLVLAWAILGIGLCFAFTAAFRRKIESSSGFGRLMPFLVFQIAQGAVGFALAKYLFNLSWQQALCFPIGALATFLALWIMNQNFRDAWIRLLLTAILAGSLVIALRLGAIPGSLAFAIALLNGAWLGLPVLESEADKDLWLRACFFAAFLVVGRAAIQYYLLTSGYAALGVVVTHPYTFVALFGGFFLPLAYSLIEQDRSIQRILAIIALGVILPIVLGIFIHVRPLAGFLMGVVVSGFLVGILLRAPFTTGLIGYMSLAAGTFGLPLFKQLSNLSRVVRLEILGGLLILVVLVFVFASRSNQRNAAS